MFSSRGKKWYKSILISAKDEKQNISTTFYSYSIYNFVVNKSTFSILNNTEYLEPS